MGRSPGGDQRGDMADAERVAVAGSPGRLRRGMRWRRSQKTRLTWDRMNRLTSRWLPPARVRHPYPEERFAART